MSEKAPRPPVENCDECHKPHIAPRWGQPSCKAHRSRRDENGDKTPCTANRIRGMEVCAKHGGSSPQAKRAATIKVVAATVADRANRIYGVPRHIDPAQGLIEEYWRSAGLVRAYEDVVSGLHLDDLVWGIVERQVTTGERQVTTGAEGGEGGPSGDVARTTARAGVHMWIKLFNEERDRWTKLGVEIARLGLESRRDEYIRAQVEVFASVLLSPELGLSLGQRRVAARLLRGLRGDTSDM